MQSYFHRAGRKVPVYVSSCAFVVPRALETLQTDDDWAPIPLARRHTLLVRQALLDPIGGPRADRSAILRRIRAETCTPILPEGEPPPLPDASPVLVRKALLLCPTGAVVAQFPEGTSPEAAAYTVKAQGWTIERPIRFLERGYVLRADPTQAPVGPLALANRLVERRGCRFAHPVMMEEVVRALRAPEAAPAA